MATIAEVNRDSKKRSVAFSAYDFMPEYMRPPQEPASPQAVFNMLKAAFNANQNN
jgi:hypothetical protein